MAFWIACSMKAIKEQIDEQPKIIKLFSINYARDLICIIYINYFLIKIRFTFYKLSTNMILNKKSLFIIYIKILLNKLDHF